MIELTATAQSRLNDYLDELRKVLSGSPAVDPSDVERDVRDHIDTALAHYPAPVDEGTLNQVLGDLGSPAQWLPGEERMWFQLSRTELIGLAKKRFMQLVQMVAGSPESYRMAYSSLFILSFGWVCLAVSQNDAVFPLTVLTTAISFILSRAALSLFGAAQLTSDQKWLLYPSLVSVYLLLVAVLLFGAGAVASVSLVVSAERSGQNEQWILGELSQIERRLESDEPILSRKETMYRQDGIQAKQSNSSGFLRPLTPMAAIFAIAGIVGLNWLLLGVFVTAFPAIVRGVFHPFADRLTRWSGAGLAAIGLCASTIGGAGLYWL